MKPYPKAILSIEKQIESLKDAEMIIADEAKVKDALQSIGYYRLRGYWGYIYDNGSKKLKKEMSFDDVLTLYNFDQKLATILFEAILKIEVALRARLSEALLIYGDALILQDSSVFDDKKFFWENLSRLGAEISRASDHFIEHNYKEHDGAIPVWAAVEIMSFGNLSKIIRNLRSTKADPDGALPILLNYYKFTSSNGNEVVPPEDYFYSWTHAVSNLRNICAHNGRIYNRAIATKPKLLKADSLKEQPKHCGVYHVIMAMKYLRPTDEVWIEFADNLKALFDQYKGKFEYSRIGFPEDWEDHMRL